MLLMMMLWQIYVADNADPPAFCTVFGHIMKSGGSTIKWALDSAQPEHERQPGKGKRKQKPFSNDSETE